MSVLAASLQVLPVAVEHRVPRIAQPVGQLRDLAVGHRVHEHRAQVVLEPFGVDQPFAVGRPRRRALTRRAQIPILVDLDRLPGFDIDIQVPRCASRYAIFRLSGDHRGRVEARFVLERNLAWLSRSHRIARAAHARRSRPKSRRSTSRPATTPDRAPSRRSCLSDCACHLFRPAPSDLAARLEQRPRPVGEMCALINRDATLVFGRSSRCLPRAGC